MVLVAASCQYVKMNSASELNFPGTVHALGVEAKHACEIYAEQTGRAHQLSADLNDLLVGPQDVVVCLTRRLTAELMRKLYLDPRNAGAPGLIVAGTSAELESTCIDYATRLNTRQKTTSQRIFVYPTLPFNIVQRGTDIISGGTCPPDQLLARLGSDSALLFISGHSNSFDMPLTLQNWLCAFLEERSREGSLLPQCQAIGRCVRFPAKPTIKEGREKGWLIPISMLRARLLMLYGCSVVKLNDGIHDPNYGLGPALLRQSGARLIITTWRAEYWPAEEGIFNVLVNEISQGQMAGAAVHAFNHSALAAQMGINLCVLGDPCFVMASEEPFPQLPTPSISFSQAAAGKMVREGSPETSLLQAAITRAFKYNPRFDPARGAGLKTELSSYVEGMAKENGFSQRDRAAGIDAALLRFLSAEPVLNEFLLPVGEIREMSEEGECPACLSPARSYSIAFPNFGVGSQTVVRCESCGNETCNIPSDWRVKLDLSRLPEGTIALSDPPPGAQILLFLVAASVGSQWFVGFWPDSRGGLSAFQLPRQLPSVPLFCQVLIASGLRLGTVGFKLQCHYE